MKLRGEGGSSRLQRQYIFNVPPLAGEYSGGSEVATVGVCIQYNDLIYGHLALYIYIA